MRLIRTGSKPATGPPAEAPPEKPCAPTPAPPEVNEPVLLTATSERTPRSSRRKDSWFSSRTAVTALRYLSVIGFRSECSRIGAHFLCSCSELNIGVKLLGC